MSKNQLHQVNASYIPEQDRLLLKINTTGQTEFRFWITRRYLALLWQVLRQMAGALVRQASPWIARPGLRWPTWPMRK